MFSPVLLVGRQVFRILFFNLFSREVFSNLVSLVYWFIILSQPLPMLFCSLSFVNKQYFLVNSQWFVFWFISWEERDAGTRYYIFNYCYLVKFLVSFLFKGFLFFHNKTHGLFGLLSWCTLQSLFSAMIIKSNKI